MTTEKDLADQLQVTEEQEGDGPGEGDDSSQVTDDPFAGDEPGEGGEGSEEAAGDESKEEGLTVESLAAEVAELKQGLSAKDTQIGTLRDTVLRQEIEREIADAEAVERQHAQVDSAAVAAGEMTAADAATRSRERQEAASKALEQRRGEREARERLSRDAARLEAASRINFAKELAEEHGVDATLLLNDPEVREAEQRGGGPAAMKFKAKELALEAKEKKVKGRTKVDSGRVGTTNRSVENMSPEEKVLAGLKRPIRQR